MVEVMERRRQAGGRLHVTVQHANAPADATHLAELAERRLAPASLAVSEFTQVMAAHVGPGLVGFSYWLEP
jgi:fatty acid-binding protein DegV